MCVRRPKRTPLSVSTELIAVVALRAAALLSRIKAHEQIDRMGSGRLVEVYPAAALIRWGFSIVERRNTPLLASSLARKLGSHLKMTTKAEDACKTNRDALDSMVAALIARASACGLCDPVPSEHSAAARLKDGLLCRFLTAFTNSFRTGDHLSVTRSLLPLSMPPPGDSSRSPCRNECFAEILGLCLRQSYPDMITD